MDLRVKKAFEIIKNRYREELSLELLAEEVGLSSFYFHRLFKQTLDETPFECLNRIRLRRASHLIAINQNLSITEIAYDCGFSSLAAFSRSFQKYYGQSPTEYSVSFSHDPSTGTQIKNAGLTVENPEIVYYPGCWIMYSHTSVFRSDLLDTFSSVKAFCDLQDIPNMTVIKLGVYNHIHLAFNGKSNQLNYYAGIKAAKKPDAIYSDRLFRIPKGKYACFYTHTAYDDLLPLFRKVKSKWLDAKSIKLKDVFAFEHLLECNRKEDYPHIKRKIYIPIQ